ncbi:hypothetical protein JW935_23965 [candidate division KSB1 bacterium]|nr:hypothetical protein [candidate division KSB1 bacterium]
MGKRHEQGSGLSPNVWYVTIFCKRPSAGKKYDDPVLDNLKIWQIEVCFNGTVPRKAEVLSRFYFIP